MIHISQVRIILNSKKPLSIKYVKRNGDIIIADNVICTSTFFQKNTANIKFVESGQFRKIRISSIIECNNQEVCL
jgi:hypothetical protein